MKNANITNGSNTEKKSFESAVKKSFKKQQFKSGGYSTMLTIFVIAIVVIINMIVSNLPTKYTKCDITDNSLYTISAETEKTLKSLEEDINIYLIAISGSEDPTIVELLDRYAGMSSHIKIKNIDPVQNPLFVEKYTDEELNNSSIIVESERRSDVIDFYEIYLYTVDEYTYYTTGSIQYSEMNFDGENQLTRAIDYVTTEKLPILYNLEGHQEMELDEAAQKYIDDDNIEIRALNLLKEGNVPDDASCIMINAPQKDISEDEAALIIEYLENGGNMLLITEYNNIEMPYIDSVAESYGMQKVDAMVMDTNTKYYWQNPYWLLPAYGEHDIVKPIYEAKMSVLMTAAHGIKTSDSYRSTITVTPLLMTSDKAYAKKIIDTTETLEKQDGDIEGSFNIAMAAEESYEDKNTRIVWIASSAVINASANRAVAGGNYDLMLNSLGWMCERENSITIHSKNLLYTALNFSEADANTWSLILTAVIPLLILAIGFTVWIRRRTR